MSKKPPQKPKNGSLNHMHIQNGVTLEKYLKLFLKNWTKKLINFEVFLVGKVPKSSVFNGTCLENTDI